MIHLVDVPTVLYLVLSALLLSPLIAVGTRVLSRRKRQQRKLAAAFDRGRRASVAGTGELGQPRPALAEHLWLNRRAG